MPDAGDAEIYLAGAVAILAEYPAAVMEKIADPRTGTRVLKDYPSLIAIRRACDALFEPLARAFERQAAHDSYVAGLIARPKRSAEEQARIDAQVTQAKREFHEALAPIELPTPGVAR